VVQAGLDGVVAAETALSLVDGERGELVIAGFSVAELALNATFEETAYLLWHGELPDASALAAFRSDLAQRRGRQGVVEAGRIPRGDRLRGSGRGQGRT